MKHINKLILTLGIAFSGSVLAGPEEGMYPMSDLSKLDLKKAGFGLTAEELFSSRGDALMNALVRVGGCTGSFVSPEGLIITNHHCAFGAVAAASSVENDYISNGYLAREKQVEKIAQGLTVRITVGYEDVSLLVIGAAGSETDPVKRLAAMREKMRLIEADAKKKDPKQSHEVSEMFLGKSYVLFHYETIQDIRMVYVPPRNIGEFGGESDNWVWPRHNGDFAFVRAYVAPDGSPAAYSEKNIPFVPKRHLKVNPNGVKAEDMVFIMGYPGRTFRHYPAAYIEYQNDYLLPYTSQTYDWQIDYMKRLGEASPEKEIAFASKMKGLANVTKNYKGKIQGIRRIDLTNAKLLEEQKLKKIVTEDPELSKVYGNLFEELNSVYGSIKADATQNLWLNQFFNGSAALSTAGRIATIRLALDTVSKANREQFIKKQAEELIKVSGRWYSPYDASLDRDFIAMMVRQSMGWTSDKQLLTLKSRYGQDESGEKLEKMLNKLTTKTPLLNYDELVELLKTKPEKVFYLKHDLVEIAFEMIQLQASLRQRSVQNEAKLAGLLPKYADLKIVAGMQFVPDANSTLRLTFGKVKGYEPEDGVVQAPFTTVSGLLAKGDSVGDYEINKKLVQVYRSGNHTKYQHPELKDVPVGLLYNLDTTGGNSGSPVMNSKGELIGVNFDRAYTATINDFAWNEAYSRSIGVDIRFILWTLDNVADADFLIQEMGVK